MKEGDWICPRCNFMNFAKNVICLECEEERPKRNGEWVCPQCVFFNYGGNTVCFRCACKRPGDVVSNITWENPSQYSYNLLYSSNCTGHSHQANSSFAWTRNIGNPSQNTYCPQTNQPSIWNNGYSRYEAATKETDMVGMPLQNTSGKSLDVLDMSEEAKAERWFKRVAEIKYISEYSKIPDEDFPSIMPMMKGVNRYVVSKRKTPVERRLTSQQYQRNLQRVSSEISEEQ
ncbi:PREDICTED: zinc finger protein VAR3, chloroplastic-like [Tarenaya hassleriana]|uniref:zinc finger protein VAR3, chloroplastic-like n=1 Tax=Tarenaya hassleriana TaxID=28532 RepID=UPI00053C1376|nr:PREDICTED: zinc finger protein VAR3, chloroplastic-like [Tarenaya hassleriana]